MTQQSAESRKPVSTDTETAIRSTVDQIQAIDRETAGYLNALAFVLTRVAGADDRITGEETRSIERILVDCALLTAAQAVLVVEIARHRARLADCGCAYGESRHLRDTMASEHRDGILRCLYAVAHADGGVCPDERAEILQVASELGFSRTEVEAFPGRTLDA